MRILTNKEDRKMVSRNIMKSREYKDSIIYKASCGCGCETYELNVEYIKEIGEVALFIWADLNYNERASDCYSYDSPWYRRTWVRIRDALKLFFTGRLHVQAEFLFEDEESIRDYLKALEAGIEKIEAYKNLQLSKSLKKEVIRK
jgi:hypothetical protein